MTKSLAGKLTSSIAALALFVAAISVIPSLAYAAAEKPAPPAVGSKPTDFTLESTRGSAVSLAAAMKEGPVVLIFLRGWPGYQCPICTKQVAELVGQADAFRAAKARVLLVYPGPKESLAKHAEAFKDAKNLPAQFDLLTDPDFVVTKLYNLRWDAKGETAFPATFVISRDGVLSYAKVSHSHGDRAPIKDVLGALPATK